MNQKQSQKWKKITKKSIGPPTSSLRQREIIPHEEDPKYAATKSSWGCCSPSTCKYHSLILAPIWACHVLLKSSCYEIHVNGLHFFIWSFHIVWIFIFLKPVPFIKLTPYLFFNKTSNHEYKEFVMKYNTYKVQLYIQIDSKNWVLYLSLVLNKILNSNKLYFYSKW